MLSIIIGLIILFICLMCSVPIGVSLGLSTAIAMATATSTPTILIAQKAFSGLDSFPLMAVPFFMLAGSLMTNGGIARRIVEVADLLVGKITGGLGMATIVSSMFFAAISGSAQATVSAMGTMMLPEMDKRGYDKAYATGLTATAGTIGVIIPPSIPFVIYGVVSGTSISDLFIAGFTPGILIGIALLIVCYITSKKRGYKGYTTTAEDGTPKKSAFRILFGAIPALLSPTIILGGIYGGIFTPTEAAVVATVYSIFVGVFIYRELDWKSWMASLRATADLCGLTALALGFSMSFANFLTMQQIPQKVAAWMTSTFSQGWILMALILGILLFVGLFVDNISSCLVLTPVLLPIARSFGVDPVHFGIVMTTALAIGFVTPPYGCNLFTASAISKLPIEKIAKAAIPFVIAMFFCLLLISYIPAISMFLVRLLA